MNYNLFKTLQQTDVDFWEYLWGTGIHKKNKTIPLPVKTLNLGEPNETVTFQIFTRFEINRPSLTLLATSLIKIHTYVLILMPLFYVLSKNFVDDRFRDPVSITFAAVAALLLYGGVNIRNDVVDHVYGYDRVNILKSNKPIARGWITAQKASTISWCLMGLSGLIAIPALVLEPELNLVVSVVAILFFLGRFAKKNSYKYNRLGEVILFIMVGAGLACGYQVALGSGIDLEILCFGILWGFGVLFLIHVNNFSHILTSYQAGILNTMTRMGFDKSQKFLVGWWSVFCILWLLFHYFYASLIWTIFGTMLLVFWSLPLFNKILKIKSPIGSDLDLIRKDAYRTFLLMAFILFSENFWYVGEKLNWTL